MGIFQKLFGGGRPAELAPVAPPFPTLSELARDTAQAAAEGEDLVELDIKGESFHQPELERIAGPKEADGKRTLVGVTMRCEPENQYDKNAIRVEVMGLLVGHVAKEHAAILGAPIMANFGGTIEARGLVVGGWKSDDRNSLGQYVERDEGSFGIRVFLTKRDTERLGVGADDIDPTLRPRWPTLPSLGKGEARLSPAENDSQTRRSSVTVTCEEHYQETILAARPDGWGERTWPLLVDLVADVENPHAKKPGRCVEVRIGELPVGYFTAAMSERHGPMIAAATSTGHRVTAGATASLGTKGGATIWRIGVVLRDHS